MHYTPPPSLDAKIRAEAARLKKTHQDLVTEILATSLAHVPSAPLHRAPGKCLCPPCPDGVLGRGLCPRHYQRARWFTRKRKLSEGWLVRHGRMLPPKGRTVEDYPAPGGAETLETLPVAPPDLMPDTLWLFGYPHVLAEREKLEGSRGP